MRLTTLLGLGLLAAACAPKPATPDAADATAAPAALTAAALDSVRAVDAAFAAAMNSQDTAAVFALYTADAKLMPPNSPILEGADLHAALVGLIAAGVSDFELTPSTAYGVGDLAYQVGTVSYKLGGVPQADKYVEVLRRGTDGKWRMVADMFSGVAAPEK